LGSAIFKAMQDERMEPNEENMTKLARELIRSLNQKTSVEPAAAPKKKILTRSRPAPQSSSSEEEEESIQKESGCYYFFNIGSRRGECCYAQTGGKEMCSDHNLNCVRGQKIRENVADGIWNKYEVVLPGHSKYQSGKSPSVSPVAKKPVDNGGI